MGDNMGVLEFIKNKLGLIKEDSVNVNKTLMDSSKEKGDISEIIKAEKSFFEKHKNDKYDFFGYMGMNDDEMPFFTTVGEHSESSDGTKFHTAQMVYAFTPAILKHCVTNLTDEWKANEAEDIAEFVEKCHVLSNAAVYMNGNWDTVINELADYLQYGMSFNMEESDEMY